YLNTITDHYEVIKDQFGREISRRYSHRTETGYIFQRRETKVDESREELSAEVMRGLQAQDAGLQSLHNSIESLAAQLASLQKDIAEQTKEYNRDLMGALLRDGGARRDIFRLRNDPLMKVLGNRKITSDELTQLQRDYPQIDYWYAHSQHIRESISPITKVLNHPAMRFMNEVVVPVATIATIMAGDVFSGGLAAPATAPALAACCVRLAPVIGRAAVTFGASEAYNVTSAGVRAYFNKVAGSGSGGTSNSGGRGPAPKKTEPPKTERVVPTQNDQITFTNEQKASGLWEPCKAGGWRGSFQSKDGLHRFVQTFEKWEYEVYKKIGKGWEHCGIMRAVGPDKGKILTEFAKGFIQK
ncbi:MAG: hypothetical protein LBR89_03635, partial [Holosporales bacterium]|nr:hypothetical protein [Holosporales bacterium]